MKKKTVSDPLLASALNPESQGLVADYAEVGIDRLTDNEFIQEIPVVKTVVGLAKGYINIRDRLFLKKVAHFLKESSKITAKERDEWFSKLSNDDPNSERDISEKMWMMIDAAHNSYKAECHGKLLRAYVKGTIEKAEHFYYLMEMVDNMPTNLLKGLQDGRYMNDDAYYRAGVKESPTPSMSEIEDYQGRSARLARSGMTTAQFNKRPDFTPAGLKLRQILREV